MEQEAEEEAEELEQEQEEIYVSGQSTVFELTNALINLNIHDKGDYNKENKDYSIILRILDLCPHPYPNYHAISNATFKDLIILACTIIDTCSYYKYFLEPHWLSYEFLFLRSHLGLLINNKEYYLVSRVTCALCIMSNMSIGESGGGGGGVGNYLVKRGRNVLIEYYHHYIKEDDQNNNDSNYNESNDGDSCNYDNIDVGSNIAVCKQMVLNLRNDLAAVRALTLQPVRRENFHKESTSFGSSSSSSGSSSSSSSSSDAVKEAEDKDEDNNNYKMTLSDLWVYLSTSNSDSSKTTSTTSSAKILVALRKQNLYTSAALAAAQMQPSVMLHRLKQQSSSYSTTNSTSVPYVRDERPEQVRKAMKRFLKIKEKYG